MDPYHSYRRTFPAQAQHCPFGGCVVCCGRLERTRREFADLVNRSWSLGERDILRRAARSALL
jgi:hypothetical protein